MFFFAFFSDQYACSSSREILEATKDVVVIFPETTRTHQTSHVCDIDGTCEEDCIYRAGKWECPLSCKRTTCRNKFSDKYIQLLRIYKKRTSKPGYGACATENIEKGQIICEYYGTLYPIMDFLDKASFMDNRFRTFQTISDVKNGPQLVVDGHHYGSAGKQKQNNASFLKLAVYIYACVYIILARFVEESCGECANAELVQMTDRMGYPHLLFIAKEPISKDDQVFYECKSVLSEIKNVSKYSSKKLKLCHLLQFWKLYARLFSTNFRNAQRTENQPVPQCSKEQRKLRNFFGNFLKMSNQKILKHH